MVSSALGQMSLLATRSCRMASGLREKGWIEGMNLLVEYRFAPDRLPALAAEFVALTPN